MFFAHVLVFPQGTEDSFTVPKTCRLIAELVCQMKCGLAGPYSAS